MSSEKPDTGRGHMRKLMGGQILGTGSFLPDNVVTNDDLARLGCDAEWILQRTGIRERRHAPPEMATSDMAVAAGERAMEAAGVEASDIDLLVLGTFTPDMLMPGTASLVQHRLGLQCPAFDLQAACAGFLYSLVTGMQYIASGCSQRALVIGADCNTRVMDTDDKRTYPLFGDGAGAVVLGPGSEEQGLLSYTLGADGGGADLLCRPTGGTRRVLIKGEVVDASHFVQMDGRPVFKWAVQLLEETSRAVLNAAGLDRDDIDLFVFHQANTRIIDAAVKSLNVDRERVVVHLDRYGNTSAGSVPIALDESFRDGRIKPGDKILMSGFGAGLAWGTTVFQW